MYPGPKFHKLNVCGIICMVSISTLHRSICTIIYSAIVILYSAYLFIVCIEEIYRFNMDYRSTSSAIVQMFQWWKAVYLFFPRGPVLKSLIFSLLCWPTLCLLIRVNLPPLSASNLCTSLPLWHTSNLITYLISFSCWCNSLKYT